MTEIKDQFGRKHDYLRISLTEKCNLRCTYCMPMEGIKLSPRKELATAAEIYEMAKCFVDLGVKKIRLTGGEPLVRKDFPQVLDQLSQLPVELAISTNAVLVDQYISLFKKTGLRKINVSLDTLQANKFQEITRRNDFEKVFENIQLLLDEGFEVKLNIVLIKSFNDDEIIDFIQFTKDKNLHIRFIEFMPFDGNKWDVDKVVSEASLIALGKNHFGAEKMMRIEDRPNDTSHNFKIQNHKGTFAIISTVTNPFCDSCNRIRLTANGKIKNCLFSAGETDILGEYRKGNNIKPLIQKAVFPKFKQRGGMDTIDKLSKPVLHENNRTMIAIGG